MMARLRIAVVHPRLGSGGSELRALWLLACLREEFAVELVTTERADLAAHAERRGVPPEIADTRQRVHRPPRLGRGSRGAALRGAALLRGLRWDRPRYALVISAYNPLDIPQRTLDFIADFSWLPRVRDALHGDATGAANDGLLKRLYGRWVRSIAAPGPHAPLGGDPWLIANSHYAAGRVAEALDIEPPFVLPPPVPFDMPARPTARAAVPTIVSLGRLSPEKRVEEQLEIHALVRREMPEARLVLIGEPASPEYGRALEARAADQPGVHFAGRLDGAAKQAELAKAWVGLHTCRGEGFGIAVAEMARAGLPVVVPEEGGAAEIVNTPDLAFRRPDEAAARLLRLLADDQDRRAVGQGLADSTRRYDIANFTQMAFRLVVGRLTGMARPEDTLSP